MLTLIQPAGPPRALEVSLGRALNGFTKLITSFSAFLKEPEATQVQTSRGSPFARPPRGASWERKAWTTQSRGRPASLGNGGSLAAPFSGDPESAAAHGEALGESPARGLLGGGAGLASGKERPPSRTGWALSWEGAQGPASDSRQLLGGSQFASPAATPAKALFLPRHWSGSIFFPPFGFELPRQQFKTGGGLGWGVN